MREFPPATNTCSEVRAARCKTVRRQPEMPSTLGIVSPAADVTVTWRDRDPLERKATTTTGVGWFPSNPGRLFCHRNFNFYDLQRPFRILRHTHVDGLLVRFWYFRFVSFGQHNNGAMFVERSGPMSWRYFPTAFWNKFHSTVYCHELDDTGRRINDKMLSSSWHLGYADMPFLIFFEDGTSDGGVPNHWRMS